MLLIAASGLASASALAQNYPLVSTMQDRSYDDRGLVINPAPGQRFFGQDAQNTRRQSSYFNAPDGLTTLDEVTRLT
jgi:glutathione peroxidase-family protein